MVEATVGWGFLSSFAVGNADEGVLILSHLLANTIFFCDADHRDIQ